MNYISNLLFIMGPFHGIRFVSDRTFTGFFPEIEIILGNYQEV